MRLVGLEVMLELVVRIIRIIMGGFLWDFSWMGCLYFLYRMLLDIMFMYSYNLNERSNQLDAYYMPDTFHKLVSLWPLVKKCKFSL